MRIHCATIWGICTSGAAGTTPAKEFEVLRYWPEDVETNFMLGLCYKEQMERRAITVRKVLRKPRHTQALYCLGASYPPDRQCTLVKLSTAL